MSSCVGVCTWRMSCGSLVADKPSCFALRAVTNSKDTLVQLERSTKELGECKTQASYRCPLAYRMYWTHLLHCIPFCVF